MHKFLWILALVVAAVMAPSARADSFDASFTCTGSCVDVPTDPGVYFPGPTIPISFFSQLFTITLNDFDNPTDFFTWNIQTNSSSWSFVINDVTNGWSNSGPSFSYGQGQNAPYGNGCVNFNNVRAPEPNSMALALLGVGMVFAARKRIRHSISQTS
jgi:hypothetical protein